MANFSEVYAKYAKRVYRFLLSLSGSEQQAEELTQQTFYKAFLHIDRFEGRSSLYTWLCGIGKNEWLMACRKKSFLPLEEISQEETEGVEAEILRREIQIAVRRASVRESAGGCLCPGRSYFSLMYWRGSCCR